MCLQETPCRVNAIIQWHKWNEQMGSSHVFKIAETVILTKNSLGVAN